MAAPHVTSVVALILEEHPDWDSYEIRNERIAWVKAGIWIIIPYSGKINTERREIRIFIR